MATPIETPKQTNDALDAGTARSRPRDAHDAGDSQPLATDVDGASNAQLPAHPAPPAHPDSATAQAGATTAPPTTPSSDGADVHKLEQLVIDALHSVYDPEIPVDIYELGLIYSIDITPQGKVSITMTLTTPACPVAGSMPGQVEKVVRMIEGVTDVVVDLVWEPTWGPAMMTESARLQLNMY